MDPKVKTFFGGVMPQSRVRQLVWGRGLPRRGRPKGRHLEFLRSPLAPLGERGRGVDTAKPETTQRCPQVSGKVMEDTWSLPKAFNGQL